MKNKLRFSIIGLSLVVSGCALNATPSAPHRATDHSGRASTASAPLTSLPLGDGHVSYHGPKVGYVYSVRVPWRSHPTRHYPWINYSNHTFNETAKPHVAGSVHWHSTLTIRVVGNTRIITGNGLPSTPTGTFPIQPSTTAYRYDRNPNHIQPHPFQWTLPAHPRIARTPSPLHLGPVGILLNGGFLFDALDASGRDAVAHEIQDQCGGHPQSKGIYHYHNLSPCITLHPKPNSAQLVGYALDGFGIYAEWGPSGKLLTDRALDAEHGRTSVVPWNGKMVKMYHYDITNAYPYTLGAFKGTPIHARP